MQAPDDPNRPKELTSPIRQEALGRGLGRALDAFPADVLAAWTSAAAHVSMLPDDLPVDVEPWQGHGEGAE